MELERMMRVAAGAVAKADGRAPYDPDDPLIGIMDVDLGKRAELSATLLRRSQWTGPAGQVFWTAEDDGTWNPKDWEAI